MAGASHIIILTTPRSGSNLLCSLLNSHAMLCCVGEIFNQRGLKKQYPTWLVHSINRFPTLYINYKLWRHKKSKPFYGFKVFPSQLSVINPIMPYLEKKGFRIIRLKRNNLLKKAISFAIAKHYDRWQVFAESEYTNELVQLDPKNILDDLKFYKDQEAIIDQLIQNKPCITVDYEADIQQASQRAVWSKSICNLLHLPEEELSSTMLPTDKRPDDQRIANLQEILDYLCQHGLQKDVDEFKLTLSKTDVK